MRREVLNAESVILIAHDFGGALAQWYVLEHPDAVERMILLSPLPANGYRMETMFQAFTEPFATVLAAGIPPSHPEDALQWYQHLELQREVNLLYDRVHAPLLHNLGGVFGTARTLATSIASGRRDYATALAGLSTKTLILYGEKESPFTRREYQRELQSLLWNSVLVEVNHSGHWTFLEQPEIVEALVTAFLREPTGSPSSSLAMHQ